MRIWEAAHPLPESLPVPTIPSATNEQQLILLDAMALGAAPGSLHRLEGPALNRLAGARSVHGLGLLQALAVSGVPLPARVIALGLEPAELGYGSALSPAVAAAVAGLVARVEQELADMTLAVSS